MKETEQTKISDSFFKYVAPSMFTMLLVGFYAIVDGFFVGRSVGDDGLAAIQIAWPITLLVMSLGTGIGTGGSIIMSIKKGEGNKEFAEKVKGNTIILLGIIGTIIMIIYLLIINPLLKLLGADGLIFDYAKEYSLVITYGAVLQIMGAGLTPIIKNIGKPIFAMIVMFIGMFTNIILDWFFMFVCGWGLFGAALATTMAQGIVALLAIMCIVKSGLCKHWYTISRSVVTDIVRIGLSPFGLTFTPGLVMIFTNWQCLAYGGSNVVAAYTVMSYVIYVIQSLSQGLSDGIQPIISYCQGAKDNKGIKKTINKAILCGIVLCIVYVSFALIFKDAIPIWYGTSSEVAKDASIAIALSMIAVPFIIFSRIMTGYLYAIDDAKSSSLLVYIDPLLLSPILLFILPKLWGVYGIWFTYILVQIILSILAFVLVKKDKVKVN